MPNIKVQVEKGVNCGAIRVFARICQNGTTDCCEDEIVNKGNNGFDAGLLYDVAILEAEMRNCANLEPDSAIDLTVQLSGWKDLNVSLIIILRDF